MGNRLLKKRFKEIYNVNSSNKIRFIRTIKKPNISLFSFIKNQIKYINKRIFLLSFIYFIILSVVLLTSLNTQSILFASGIPFLSLMMVESVTSSKNNNMEELEMTTLYSLKMIILARMIVVGTYTISFIGIIAFFISNINCISFARIIIYFFVPYLLSMYFNLLLLQRFRSDGFRYCFVSSSCVWLIELLIVRNFKSIFTFSIYFLILFLIVSLVMVIHETRKYLNRLENYVWNL